MEQTFYEPPRPNGHALPAHDQGMISRIAAYVAALRHLRSGTRVAAQLLDDAAAAARKRPVPVILAALGIGLVAGLVLSQRSEVRRVE